MLTKAFKEQWITALESGNYKKGKACLRDKYDNFCRLGVAADLLVTQGKAKWSEIYGSLHVLEVGDYRSDTLLPPVLRLIIGLSDYDHRELVSLNDSSATFAPVIEVIKKLPARD